MSHGELEYDSNHVSQMDNLLLMNQNNRCCARGESLCSAGLLDIVVKFMLLALLLSIIVAVVVLDETQNKNLMDLPTRLQFSEGRDDAYCC